jgi:hypothetical protein
MQRRGKHSSTTIEAFYCVVGAEAIYGQLHRVTAVTAVLQNRSAVNRRIEEQRF